MAGGALTLTMLPPMTSAAPAAASAKSDGRNGRSVPADMGSMSSPGRASSGTRSPSGMPSAARPRTSRQGPQCHKVLHYTFSGTRSPSGMPSAARPRLPCQGPQCHKVVEQFATPNVQVTAALPASLGPWFQEVLAFSSAKEQKVGHGGKHPFRTHAAAA